MNILVLAHRVPYPPNKGEKIRTFNQLRYLAEQGHTLTIATPVEHPSEIAFASRLREQLNVDVLIAELPAKSGRIIRGLLQRKPISASHFYSGELQKQIDSTLESNTPDVLMCTSSAMAEYVLHCKTMTRVRKHGIKLVMDFMDLDSAKWRQYADVRQWPLSLVFQREAKLLARMEEKIINTFDASLFVSIEESDLLQSNAPQTNRIHVIRNGVDQKTYQPLARDKQTTSLFRDAVPVLLFTGVMDYFPNEDAVLWFAEKVWPDIIRRHPKARFVIAGMRPSKKVRDLANLPQIEVTGYIENIVPYYQEADFLVAPFRVARGIQNKILQAMACGLPVVASPEGAAGINYSADNLLVAKSPADYAITIDSLLTSAARYKSISDAGISLVSSQYSWDDQNAKLERLLYAQQHSTAQIQSSYTSTNQNLRIPYMQ